MVAVPRSMVGVGLVAETQTDAERRRVLIAEDEALIRLDLAEMLVEEGYEVVGEAGDGETAVRLAEELKPDLVILDIKMPIMDGLAAAERIAGARIAPVIILTAFSQRDLVERARAAGAMAYLVKPFQKSDLVPAVEIALSRYSEIAALESEVAGLTDRLEIRKIGRARQGRADDDVRDDRAAGVQVDPAHRDGPPDDHEGGRRADPRRDRRRRDRRAAHLLTGRTADLTGSASESPPIGVSAVSGRRTIPARRARSRPPWAGVAD